MTNTLNSYKVRLFAIQDGVEKESVEIEAVNGFTAAFAAGMTIGALWFDTLGFLRQTPMQFLSSTLQRASFAVDGEGFAADAEVSLWNVTLTTPEGPGEQIEFNGRNATSAAVEAGIWYMIQFHEQMGFLSESPDEFTDRLIAYGSIDVVPKSITDVIDNFLNELFGEGDNLIGV